LSQVLSEHFICGRLSKPHLNSVKVEGVIIFVLYVRKEDTERESNLTKVTQLVSSTAGI
jgi:hypothetical protein